MNEVTPAPTAAGPPAGRVTIEIELPSGCGVTVRVPPDAGVPVSPLLTIAALREALAREQSRWDGDDRRKGGDA